MGKLLHLSGKEICQILSRHGFANVRQRGSHVVMQRAGNLTVTVPIPMHKEIKVGTLLSIIRQSGVARSEFETK